MGRYTVAGPEIDAQLEPILASVVEEAKQLPRLRSVLLTGGFGRGEGSIRLDKDGRAQPVKDFDFHLIFTGEVPLQDVADVETRITARIGGAERRYKYSRFTVDLNASTTGRMNLAPDITTIDPKFGSQVLWGEDVRGEIRHELGDVPERSGLHVLLQKGLSLVGQMSPDVRAGRWPNAEAAELFEYEVNKVFVEIGTALAIKARAYDCSYAARGRWIVGAYAGAFPDLAARRPQLASQVGAATERKLRWHERAPLAEPPMRLWQEARGTLLDVIDVYVGASAGTGTLAKRAARRFAQLYYRGQFEDAGAQRLPRWLARVAAAGAAPAYQTLQRAALLRQLRREDDLVAGASRWRARSPRADLFEATLAMLDGAASPDAPDPRALAFAARAFGFHARSEPRPTGWDEVWRLHNRALSFQRFVR